MITSEQLDQLISQWVEEDPTHRTAFVILQERSRVDENHEMAGSLMALEGKMNSLRPIFRHILSCKDDDDLKPLQRLILLAAAEALAGRQGVPTDDDEYTKVEKKKTGEA